MFEDRRVQAVRDLADVPGKSKNALPNTLQFIAKLLVRIRQLLPDPAHADRQCGDILNDVVMQLSCNAPSLLLLCRKKLAGHFADLLAASLQFGFCPLALRDVSYHSECACEVPFPAL